ncbi:MFS transporter [Streptomyces sp. NPDC050504]|uniref:MFS transporter n=1 Tax=Streptomyces sp. NPDC050504 TaxID=3365618 RepID=UPI0037AAF95F
MKRASATLPPSAALPPSVLALAAATFAVVTTEMLPVGLLTSLGDGLHVTHGTAGLTVMLPGIVAALCAPLLPLLARRADRRVLLVSLLALLAGANALSALAPSFGVLLAARVVVGICIGGVWAIAAGLAVRLVREETVGRATAVVFSGIAVASVIGVPAGTFMGGLAGWRWAFAAMAALALAVAALLAATLPRLRPEPGSSGALREVAGLAPVRRGLLVVALLVTGHFAAYTYVRPVLERVDGVGPATVSGLLLAYGVAGIVGNFTGGALAPRGPRRVLLVIAAGLGSVVLLAVPAGGSLLASAALLVAWGLLYGGVSVSAQNWLLSEAPAGAREAASALFAGVFNAAIALGALAGGRASDGHGAAGALWTGGALALLAGAVAGVAGFRGASSARSEYRERAGRAGAEAWRHDDDVRSEDGPGRRVPGAAHRPGRP